MEALVYIDDFQHQAEQQRKAQLAAFAASLVSKRKEAVDARKLSGIEDIWQEDEQYYGGIDQYNQGEVMLKPTSVAGRVQIRSKSNTSTKSTVFVNITQPYVDLVSAREFDMLFPVDDKPFAIEPTPVPDIDDVKASDAPMPDGQMTEGEAAQGFLAEASHKAELAETQIWDWLAESNWHTEGRKVVEQKNRLGTGVLKGPYPKRCKEKAKATDPNTGRISIQFTDVTKPASRQIDVWNLYPDPACGSNIHDGSYIWEKDTVTGKQLKALKGGGYLDDEIDRVLEEGPSKKYLTDEYRRNGNRYFQDQDNYEIWYYHGVASKEDLRAALCPCDKDLDVMVVLVNDSVIKATQAVLDSGEFPYDVFVYQSRDLFWAGSGVGRQVRTAQNMVNAATRNLMDNAGVSAGPQIIFRKGIVRPADGVWEITPLKIWMVDEDANIKDVEHAFTSVVIPTMQQELEAIIRLALEFAERATSMPLMLQGQQGAATETVGGMQILQSNSNTVLRRTAKLFDDVVERHIDRYYEWLMQHADSDEAKGDYKIIAKGSSALYERDAQNQMILQLVQYAANPAFMLSPERLMVEILKSNKISPDRVMLTDEEKQQQAQQPPPADPALEVAKLRGQTAMDVEKLKQQSDMQEIEAKSHEMQSEMALKLQMAQQDRDHEMKIKQLELQMKMMELSASSQQSLESIKAALADTSMRLNVQQRLSQDAQAHEKDQNERDKAHDITKLALQPPTEPVGRAENGRAYEQ